MSTNIQTQIAVTEQVAAQALSVSVAWLRKDRIGKRTVPFFKMGKAVRYNLKGQEYHRDAEGHVWLDVKGIMQWVTRGRR